MERKLIAAAVSSALALPMAAQAVEFSVSGHVNRAIISVDDGSAANDGDLQHVDATSSETRFRFTGSQELDNGMTAGVNLELGRPGNWRTRHAAVSLSTAGGTLTMGQTGLATSAAPYANLGGASWLGGVTNWCSYHFITSAATDVTSPACISNDPSRAETLKYDTPAIGPASISISTGNNDYLDALLKISGSMGDAGYDLRIGHEAEHDHDGDATTPDGGDVTTMSGAVSFGQGTSVAAAWSQKDSDGQEGQNEYQYLALDHSYGAGSIGVYFKSGEAGGVDGSLWGVGIGHGLGGGVTAYAGYRQVAEDGQQDVDLLLAGMRVSFN